MLLIFNPQAVVLRVPHLSLHVIAFRAQSKEGEAQGRAPSCSLLGVPVMAQWLMNVTRNHEVEGSIPGLAHGLRIRRCCGCSVGRQLELGLDP